MTKKHEIKILEGFANDIISGVKTFELRKNDRDYERGDWIKFTAIKGDSSEIYGHPINNKFYKITYVLNGYGLRDGYVALGIQELDF